MSSRRAPRRVFIGLVEVSGFYGRLASGFRDIGVDATVADISGNPFSYPGTPPPRIVRWAEDAARMRRTSGRWTRPLWRVVYRVSLLALFAWAAVTHDAFIFTYRSTFLWFVDLPILKLFGRRIIYVFNGSDARPSYIDGAEVDALGGHPAALIASTRRKRSDIRRIERWADEVVAHPLYLHLFKRPTVGIQLLGVPSPARPHPSRPPDHVKESGWFTVLHAPSNPAVKGTAAIRRAVSEAGAGGLPIRLVELAGVPNDQIQQALANCDFVVDQAYSDLPMSVFALEAASHGKAAVVGSYGWAEIESLPGAGWGAPIEATHPDRIADAIRRLAEDTHRRHQLGEAARRFSAGWSPPDVARRYLELLAGRTPVAWLTQPAACTYLYGVGLSEASVRATVNDVLRTAGVAGLCLDHRPDLERAFVAFAAGEVDGGPG